ncbi:hypothetical protein ACS0TY_005434 [Phlomoides rotata]
MVDCMEFWTNNMVVGLGLRQLLSLLVTSTGFSSSELTKKGINAPTSQSLLTMSFWHWCLEALCSIEGKLSRCVLRGYVPKKFLVYATKYSHEPKHDWNTMIANKNAELQATAPY